MLVMRGRKGEEDSYNNMNVCIPVYVNMEERGNAIKYIVTL